MKTIVLCDSSDFVSFQRFENSILNCLDFYQIWYKTIDISYTLIDSNELEGASLLLIAQEGTGKKLGPSDWKTIFKQVSSGAGLVIFDGMLSSYQELIYQYTGIGEFKIGKTSQFNLEESWITSISAAKTVNTKVPVLINIPSEIPENWNIFLTDKDSNPVGMWKTFGQGKLAIISISQGIWHKSCLGHTNGFDSVFWRALVHTAKKPFVFKAIPPFVTCRINDASGSSENNIIKNFSYVRILNETGFIPHIGLCIHDISDQAISDIRDLYFHSKAEFSAHSFTRKKEVIDPSIYLGSDGKELSFDQLRSSFQQIDNAFFKLNITGAKTINAHRSQIGYNSIGFFKQRNQTFSMNLLKPGRVFSDPRALTWEPKPFGVHNFCIDYLDENNTIFNAVFHPGEITPYGARIDFLDNAFQNFSPYYAAEKGISQIKRGLENLTCGCLMFHEERLERLSPQDFETVVGIISQELKKFPHIFKPYDYVAAYLKNRLDSKIVKMEFKNSHLKLVLSGKSTMSQLVYCFLQDGEDIVQRFLEIPPFEKSIEVFYKIKQTE